MDTKITAVENTFFYTQVNFTFTSPSSGGGCWLAAPDSKEAMYLQVGTKKYKLLSTNGIANEKFPGTRVKKGEKLEFYARFQKLPDDVKSFDLIEGASGNWSFYGVQLGHTAKKDNTSSSSSSAATQNKQEARERFKRDYNKIILYDGETEKWQDAIESYNSFVFNVNSNGDFISYFDGGEKNECRRISDVENHTNDDGDEYQVMKFLDEAGEEMVLFLYSEDLMVVDYNTGNAILFTKHDLEIIEEEGFEIIYDDEEFTYDGFYLSFSVLLRASKFNLSSSSFPTLIARPACVKM